MGSIIQIDLEDAFRASRRSIEAKSFEDWIKDQAARIN